MDISNEMIDKLADLAKLEFSATEKEELKGDLSKITAFFEKLNELDTDQIEPLIFMTNEVNVLRPDEVVQPINKEEALRNADSASNLKLRINLSPSEHPAADGTNTSRADHFSALDGLSLEPKAEEVAEEAV